MKSANGSVASAGTPDMRSPQIGQAFEDDRNGTHSPAPRPGSPQESTAGDADWSFARREVVAKLNGQSVDLQQLGDQDLNALYKDILRVRGSRRGTSTVSRPESRASFRDSAYGDEDDQSSSNSRSPRPQSGGTYTTEGTSVDSTLAFGGALLPDVDVRLEELKSEMETQLSEQREEYEVKLKTMVQATAAAEDIINEKAEMQAKLTAVQAEMNVGLSNLPRHETSLIITLSATPRCSAKSASGGHVRNTAQEATSIHCIR